ncbi:hypothetical protein D3C75_913590 [compost metagenome]
MELRITAFWDSTMSMPSFSPMPRLLNIFRFVNSKSLERTGITAHAADSRIMTPSILKLDVAIGTTRLLIIPLLLVDLSS